MLQFDALHHLLDTALAFGAVESAHLRNEVEITGGRHVRIGRSTFGQITDQFLRRDRIGADIDTADGHVALGRAKEAGDHLHGRRLACAVWAQKAENLATADTETDPVNCGKASETSDQI